MTGFPELQGTQNRVHLAAHIQRRIEQDDWLPFRSKDDALQSWQKLGGIRVQVLMAYDLI